MRRKICIVTGSRAEYGLLRPLIQEIKDAPDLKLQLIATGMHLSAEFGLTYQQIEKDGFHIDEKIEILLDSDTAVAISKSMGLSMIGFAEAYERLAPEVIVVLGDRFELLGPVAAALVSRIPVAHIHGGEITEGALDDAIRHSITKMSHLHFTSTEQYRKRVIQLGERPERIFSVGALGLDNIKKLRLLSKKQLEQELNFKFNGNNLLVTFHPVTLEDASEQQFQQLLDVLDELGDTNIIFTKANADAGGRIINKMIDDYVLNNPERTTAFVSMGQLRYLSTMQFVDAVVGNSSSGIIEAPSFKIGTINIGDRQKGRIKAESVIDCKPAKQHIRNAIKKLYSKGFNEGLKRVVNPYGGGDAAGKIKNTLRDYDISNIMKKGFYDVDFHCKG